MIQDTAHITQNYILHALFFLDELRGWIVEIEKNNNFFISSKTVFVI